MTELTAERLRQVVRYEPETGYFYWRVKPPHSRVVVGGRAGFRDRTRGYWLMSVGHVSYLGHRLAWLYVHGQWPSKQIDHKNRDRADNRLCNLREADFSQQQANRLPLGKFGVKGVCYRPKNTRRPWVAFIQIKERYTYLGCFAKQEDAAAAYKAAAEKHHGEFARVA